MATVMKKRPLFSLLTVSLLIFSSGCGFLPGGGGGEGDPAADLPPADQDNGVPEVPLASVSPLPPVDMASLGLITPTSPEQRLGEIFTGRTNPFELIPVNATVRQSVCQVDDLEEMTTWATGETVASAPAVTGVSPEVTPPISNGNGATTPAGTAETPDPTVPAPPAIVPEPPPLYPNDARAVVVSGIIEIGSTPYAIVRAPEEPVARNVTVGDRLSGGKVKVQSINVFASPPNVILEQYGDTVTRDVGAEALPPLTPPPPPEPTPLDLDTPEGRAALEAGGTNFVGPAGPGPQVPGSTPVRAPRPALVTRTIPLQGSEGEGAGFGEIRNLAVLRLAVNERGDDLTSSLGILCNAGDETLEVRRLTFQVEDVADNTILDSIQINLARPYFLEKGQRLEFDGNAPRFRGRTPQEVVVKLVDWSSTQAQTARNTN